MTKKREYLEHVIIVISEIQRQAETVEEMRDMLDELTLEIAQEAKLTIMTIK